MPAQSSVVSDTKEAQSELQKILARHPEASSQLEALLRGEHRLRELHPDVIKAKSNLEQAILLADGMAWLRRQLSDDVMRSVIVPLAGSPRGFRTDKNYSIEVLREVVIEALILGLPLTGNHFNIISGRLYVTREGFTYLLKNMEGLTDFRVDSVGIPKIEDGWCMVEMRASWKYNGMANGIDRIVLARVNSGQGFDAPLGKADRKIKRIAYELITGTTFTPDGELDDTEAKRLPAAPAGQASPQAVIDKLKATKPPAIGDASAEPTDEQLAGGKPIEL